MSEMKHVRIIQGDCREVLPTLEEGSVNCCVTSPPYWGLRDYGVEGQLGLEPTYQEYVDGMVAVFRDVKRVLRDDGTLWLNLGDSYSRSDAKGGSGPNGKNASYSDQYTSAISKRGSSDGYVGRADRPGSRAGSDFLKPKDLVGIPWRVAFALQADGWYLRQDIIWHKPNPMPESVRDRCTKSHEYIFLLSKSERYYFDADAIAEPAKFPEGSWGRSKCYDEDDTGKLKSFYGNGSQWKGGENRNKRSVWTVSTQPYKEAHFATFPQKLIEPCIQAGCPEGGTVLDPFHGSGTTGDVAVRYGCRYIGIELNQAYIDMSRKRFQQPRLCLEDPS